MTNTVANGPQALSHTQIRELLAGMLTEVHAAQRYIADGYYELAAECIESVGGMSEVVSGLKALAEESPPCRCSGGCDDCAGFDVAEYR